MAFPSRTAAVAYFSMEVGLEPAMATYSGGLGRASDALRAGDDFRMTPSC
jgi:hypothetical protein